MVWKVRIIISVDFFYLKCCLWCPGPVGQSVRPRTSISVLFWAVFRNEKQAGIVYNCQLRGYFDSRWNVPQCGISPATGRDCYVLYYPVGLGYWTSVGPWVLLALVLSLYGSFPATSGWFQVVYPVAIRQPDIRLELSGWWVTLGHGISKLTKFTCI